MSAAADAVTLAAYRLGWRGVRLLPERAAYRVFDRIAAVMHRRDGRSVQRMRRNYARVRPELDDAALERLVAAGLRSYLRYWCDAFRLPDRSRTWLQDHVEVVGVELLRERVARGEGITLFLGHLGNWDTLGAWATTEVAPVTTVAERLRPEELFEQFLDFRRSLGMTILPLTGGQTPFPTLVRAARAGAVIPLLSDRDLTRHGVDVTLCGHPARMAAGPAAIAVTAGTDLFVTGASYRPRPDGGYDVVGEILGPVRPPEGLPRREQIAAMTQECADLLATTIVEHTEDWHMMQRVFTDEPSREG